MVRLRPMGMMDDFENDMEILVIGWNEMDGLKKIWMTRT